MRPFSRYVRRFRLFSIDSALFALQACQISSSEHEEASAASGRSGCCGPTRARGKQLQRSTSAIFGIVHGAELNGPFSAVSSTWGICTRRAVKLYKARSRLYRSHTLQVNTHLTQYTSLHRPPISIFCFEIC